jgi:hypothetical protein
MFQIQNKNTRDVITLLTPNTNDFSLPCEPMEKERIKEYFMKKYDATRDDKGRERISLMLNILESNY